MVQVLLESLVSHDDGLLATAATYLGSLRNMLKMAELRFLRGRNCRGDAESETAEGEADRAGDCTDPTPGSRHSVACWCFSPDRARRERERERDLGSIFAEERSLGQRWSLEVREGAEVRLVDCVSCEWIDFELLSSLSNVMDEMARAIVFGGGTKR